MGVVVWRYKDFLIFLIPTLISALFCSSNIIDHAECACSNSGTARSRDVDARADSREV